MSTAPTATAEAPGRRRARSWVAHLASGGTTPWSTWLTDETEGPESAAPQAGPSLPGAQQLELLRRLNEVGRADRALVRRVLTAAALGRGRHDLELVGTGSPGRFGPAPVDPADLTDDDLLRVAVGLLAADVVQTDSSATPGGGFRARSQTNRGSRRPRRVRSRYRLVGDPELATPLRAALVADGRPPGGRGAAVLVLGGDLATMLAHAWTAGSFAEGGPSWPDYLEVWRQRDAVPRRVDLAAIADRWRSHPGTGRLAVVLDLAQVPALLHLPRRAPALPTPLPLPAAAADLGRRTATALGLLVAPERREALLTHRLRPRLAQVAHAMVEPGPSVPEEHRVWVGERAAQLRDRLTRSGHPIVGEPDALLPRWSGHDSPPPSSRSALDLAIRLLLTDRTTGAPA